MKNLLKIFILFAAVSAFAETNIYSAKNVNQQKE
jgi:hypothetical protein